MKKQQKEQHYLFKYISAYSVEGTRKTRICPSAENPKSKGWGPLRLFLGSLHHSVHDFYHFSMWWVGTCITQSFFEIMQGTDEMMRPVNNRFSTKINIYLHNQLEATGCFFFCFLSFYQEKAHLAMLWGTYRVLRIKPVSAACRVNSFPDVLTLWPLENYWKELIESDRLDSSSNESWNTDNKENTKT